MNILVIGGMHGNEPLGLELVKQLQRRPIANVDVVLANEQAIQANARFIEQDLNRSFPGDASSAHYEQRRAAELSVLCKNYDVVLDFHNTYCPDNDCSFVGESTNEMLLAVSSELGLKRVIVADYNCINKYASNCLSVEVSMASRLNNWRIWRQKIKKISKAVALEPSEDIQRYRFAYRMTLEDNNRLQLDDKSLVAFMPIAGELATALGVTSPAYPIFIGDKFTPYNYGGIVNEL